MKPLRALESSIAVASLFLLAFLPVSEIVLRTFFNTSIPSQSQYIVHLVLLTAYVGGMITSRSNAHLAVGGTVAGEAIEGENKKKLSAQAAVLQSISGSIAFSLAWAQMVTSGVWVVIAFSGASPIGFFPVRVLTAVIPIAFGVMAFRFWGHIPTPLGRRIALIGLGVGTILALPPLVNVIDHFYFEVLNEFAPDWLFTVQGLWYDAMQLIAVPLILLLVISAFIGTPLFIVLSGTAYLLFARSFGSLEVITNEAYTMLTSSAIPAIPLFTLAGFILSESKAGSRLIEFFQAVFGWFPGGMVIGAVLVSVFFTTFTGASGVTILALGGLLYTILHKSGHHSERFTIGLLTGTSNVGLLFPPSLALILYGTIAQVNIAHVFLGGLIPGALIVLTFCVMGVFVSLKTHTETTTFNPRRAALAAIGALPELLLPIVIAGSFFSGLTTLVETGAVAVMYVLIVQVLVKQEIPLKKLPEIALKAIKIIGGVLVILGAARGLSYFIIDAQIPAALTAWVADNISSRIVFLILLNLALLVTGCFMDMFSAIMVVAPLVLPLGAHFAIEPVHLAIIFVSNLCLGFITPPVGLELFLASYRFNKPLTKVYRSVLPFFLAEFAIVLLITYVPWLTTALLP